MRKLILAVTIAALAVVAFPSASSQPVRARKAMVISANAMASQIGGEVLSEGGSAVDAAVATAFALAVVHPTAGNIGGGGFMVVRTGSGAAAAYDFRETAPAASSPTMFLNAGKYDADLHHNSYISVGVPGTVAGLHLAWTEHGTLPWKRLVDPAVKLARDGFPISVALARSLAGTLRQFKRSPAALAQFSKKGEPYEAGEILRLPDLARTLQRIADRGAAGFYQGETADLIAADMKAHGGLMTLNDLKNYQAKKRQPVRGTYRGYGILSMPPPSSGGTALVEMLNVLEGYDLKANGFGSADTIHLVAESMRRAYADRAENLGDADFNPSLPIDRLTSKDYAATLRKTIGRARASKSSPTSFTWPTESNETTHLSIVDDQQNAVSMTYTLEAGYGSKIVVAGGGFLLNNEMGDFNAGPGLTTAEGLIGTPPNMAAPGKRMLSSMTPAILTKDGKLAMVTGSPGGRTIINTVLLTILNVVDFEMNAQEAVDAGRFHHQWLPDRITYEKFAFSPDTLNILKARGHDVRETDSQGVAAVIVVDPTGGVLEGGLDRRQADGGGAVR
ncbi:MAG: gamma-glutamyltransferase [Acidobacteria bacterium RIFCSPLOWO2_02_FULL_65_29]|nr:MAG: gamma-glutamyltransferase [Acidobacteria bacterium RIFCSPLOWO2_02_FULL_65_29]